MPTPNIVNSSRHRPLAVVAICAALLTSACATGRSATSTVNPVPPPSGPVVVTGDEPGAIPAGQLMDVRLQETLSSATATVEQRFRATTAVDLMQSGRVLVPEGSDVQGVVSAVDRASRLDRTGSLTLALTSLRVNGREIPLRGMATQVQDAAGQTG